MPVFFIQSTRISNQTVTIDDPLLSHLSKSLRIREGEKIWVGDEHRVRYHVRVDHLDSNSLQASIIETVAGPPTPPASVVLAQAILKGDRMNWVIQKATELGVTTIIPLLTSRVIARPPAGRIRTARERWQRIAVDAAQQSEQWEFPASPKPWTCPNCSGTFLMRRSSVRYSNGVPSNASGPFPSITRSEAPLCWPSAPRVAGRRRKCRNSSTNDFKPSHWARAYFGAKPRHW